MTTVGQRHASRLAVVLLLSAGLGLPAAEARAAPSRGGALRATWELLKVFFGPPPCVPSPYPVLDDAGLTGLALDDPDVRGGLARLFPCAAVKVDRTQYDVHADAGESILNLYFSDDTPAGARISLAAPGLTTVHGLRVGQPLAAVLAVRARRRCQLRTAASESRAQSFIRCWVGNKPAHFRYVAFLPESLASLTDEPPTLPDLSTSRAIEAWLPTSGLKIDLILWHRTPDAYEAP